MTQPTVDLTIVGSIGIDTIETPAEKQEEILGGSCSYACAAASFFTHTGMVGVVGTPYDVVRRDRNAVGRTGKNVLSPGS